MHQEDKNEQATPRSDRDSHKSQTASGGSLRGSLEQRLLREFQQLLIDAPRKVVGVVDLNAYDNHGNHRFAKVEALPEDQSERAKMLASTIDRHARLWDYGWDLKRSICLGHESVVTSSLTDADLQLEGDGVHLYVYFGVQKVGSVFAPSINGQPVTYKFMNNEVKQSTFRSLLEAVDQDIHNARGECDYAELRSDAYEEIAEAIRKYPPPRRDPLSLQPERPILGRYFEALRSHNGSDFSMESPIRALLRRLPTSDVTQPNSPSAGTLPRGRALSTTSFSLAFPTHEILMF